MDPFQFYPLVPKQRKLKASKRYSQCIYCSSIVTEVTRISVQPLYFTNHTPTVLYNQKYKEYEITKNVEISTK